MIRVPQLIRAQCRHSLAKPLVLTPHIFTRARSGGPARRPGYASKAPRAKHAEPEPEIAQRTRPNVTAADVTLHLSTKVQEWSTLSRDRVLDRLVRFGIPRKHAVSVLRTYVKAVQSEEVFDSLNYGEAQLERIAYDVSSIFPVPLDQHLTKILFEWASHPDGQRALEAVVPQDVVSRIQALFHAADLSNIAWDYPLARRSRPRRFIMHVGPTNSGKTHNALRALAAAKRGIYAGPLRLLAYEIYDRLNKGQIVPLGVEPDPELEPDSQSNVDIGDAEVPGKGVVVTKSGNPRFARQCNMITGEEQKIVSEQAPLMSCTVEMVPTLTTWDVAVIDEIQLISDKARGGAWTEAVLGICAKEIHLCGEESAIPLIESIVNDLGDTLEVNRYERLTPLVVAEKSLEGNLKNIEKGDCVVSFSRTGIFGMKTSIEKEKKLRCALAYGRLPPELRSEQAALFNDPNSDYDVLVGSDAIGMGLNLKIKRIVFEKVHKFDGGRSRLLSPSQIKQIAGRAGRFGLHGDNTQGGVVTTLYPGDLEVVRKALAAPFEPIRYAKVQMGLLNFHRVVQALPAGFSQRTVADVFQYVAKLPPRMEFHDMRDLLQCFKFIDYFSDCLTLDNRVLVQNAPTTWRDDGVVNGATAMMELYRDKVEVRLDEALHRAGLLKHLNSALLVMDGNATLGDPKGIVQRLGNLEMVHKTIVLYLWYSYRLSVAFPDQPEAFELRRLTELAMDWCLEALHQARIGAKNPTAEARKRVLERRSSPTEEIAASRSSRVPEHTNRGETYQNIIVR
ncbi:P-loop containing nucleoside triphosphate hydrolase protein [Trametes polyzona]|nr:P-loop containing nucleoside triphosphate hydrolase protein [Trametes polyzona]